MVLPTPSLHEMLSHHLKTYFDAHEGAMPTSGLYRRVMSEIEASLIQETLARTNGNQIKAAEILGINRNTLRKKMHETGVCVKKQRR